MKILTLAKSTPRSGRGAGDFVTYFPDSHQFGEREDRRVWIANGNDPDDWPGTFLVWEIPQLTESRAKRLGHKYRRLATIVDENFAHPDRMDRIVMLGPHRWRMDLLPSGPLSAAQRRQLRDEAYLRLEPVTRAFMNQLIIDRQSLDDFNPDGEKTNEEPAVRVGDVAADVVGMTAINGKNAVESIGHTIGRMRTPRIKRLPPAEWSKYANQIILQQRPPGGTETGQGAVIFILVEDL